MRNTRTEIGKIHDLWLQGRLRIEFRRIIANPAFVRRCAETFTKRTGKVNLLGSVRENFAEIVPLVVEQLERERDQHEKR